MLVRLVKDWESKPTFDRQTSLLTDKWKNIEITFEEVDECDLLIVFNRPKKEIKTKVPKGNKWLVAMEPPTVSHKFYIDCYKYFDKVFTQFPLKGKNIIPSHGALPWHIGKNFDQLENLQLNLIDKKNRLSCIASNLNWMKGHELRLDLIDFLKKDSFAMDLYGKGINFVPDKWDALYPYMYSIAIENTSKDHYWTEKITDCFLSWTMPVYWGAKNIFDYFPKESIIWIDPNNKKKSKRIIEKAIEDNLWNKNLDAIIKARKKVMYEYQLFPFIKHHYISNLNSSVKLEVTIPPLIAPWEDGFEQTLWRKFEYNFRRLLNFKPF
ncbi:glycosyltransferase family 10 domain-containing protein [Flammeovirga sp. OC4]|uniref:glycosyltransferase family 10 domain-containing protein n=1 Tax=Flammeovirga sp. OC4 TaxID=1382345 RepID=UPI000694902D|nr:glycosyltransferase family 10 [Flammeovirga sp. OC4]